MVRSDRALVTEIINLETLLAANAPQELFTPRASWRFFFYLEGSWPPDTRDGTIADLPCFPVIDYTQKC